LPGWSSPRADRTAVDSRRIERCFEPPSLPMDGRSATGEAGRREPPTHCGSCRMHITEAQSEDPAADKGSAGERDQPTCVTETVPLPLCLRRRPGTAVKAVLTFVWQDPCGTGPTRETTPGGSAGPGSVRDHGRPRRTGRDRCQTTPGGPGGPDAEGGHAGRTGRARIVGGPGPRRHCPRLDVIGSAAAAPETRLGVRGGSRRLLSLMRHARATRRRPKPQAAQPGADRSSSSSATIRRWIWFVPS
jgi:hypothetical protein